MLLAVPALWAPARLVSDNFVGIPHFERLFALAGILFLIGISCRWLLMKAGVAARTCTYTAFFLLVGLVAAGPFVRQFGSVIGIGVVVLAVGVIAALSHLRPESTVADAIVVATAVALISGPIVASLETASAYGESTVDMSVSTNLELSSKPDIWLVVFDGYSGRISMEKDLGVPWEEQLLASLQEAGFVVPNSVWASYPNTKLSVPSLLNMDYPASQWVDNGATTQDLYDVIAGESVVVQTLLANGYETHMVESGWSGSSCGDGFQVCVASPIYDAGMNYIAFNSILGDTGLVRPGFAFAHGAQSMMDWMVGNAERISHDGRPSFVFAHLVTPHPPFFLDEGCETVVDEQRDGFFFPHPGVSDEDRNAFFRDQLECVDNFVSEFWPLLAEDDVLILTSDHGMGRYGQMGADPSEWTYEDVRERLNVLLALRGTDQCFDESPIFLPQVMARLFGCLSGDTPDLVTPRIFLGPDTEVGTRTLERLLRE